MNSTDQTKEQIAVMQAFIDGATIECSHRDRGEPLWTRIVEPCWDWNRYSYRAQPKKFRRPLESRDLPPFFWIRRQTEDRDFAPLMIDLLGVYWIDPRDPIECFSASWNNLSVGYYWSVDRKTWKTFYVEEES
jgi:hypothetical protein